MAADAFLSLFESSAVRTVAAGTAGLGLAAGAVGSFAVLRRQSLQGDMVSHAALPGLAAAFLLGAREPVLLVLGGAASGWLAMLAVGAITRRSRVPFDAALGGALAVFFGLGLVLMTYAQHHVPDASRYPLDRYLFGQAAILRDADLQLIGGLAAGIAALLAAFWKEFKLLSFDPDYATSLGYPVRALDLLLTTLTVVAVVVGLKAVGVVLMTALLVAPAAAARQWTNRLGSVVILSGLFGAAAGAGGAVFSHVAGGGVSLPTGPTIVLTATALVLLSLGFGTARGLVWAPLRRMSAARAGV
ncbi:MAG TPA: iron chelate uptake ABC transporter family permease subunit [Urbifossiella sp.]|jgi:manganese/zinc/iron transport system permease protein|nr:iron chelate uptake ABC transporter family permease subunit [Urbifossiella sp.]